MPWEMEGYGRGDKGLVTSREAVYDISGQLCSPIVYMYTCMYVSYYPHHILRMELEIHICIEFNVENLIECQWD